MIALRISILLLLGAAAVALSATGASASRCLAMAERAPLERLWTAPALPVRPAALLAQTEGLAPDQVRLTYVGHSTFRIETPADVIVATDYAGYAGSGRVPDIVTMNRAHETHYTNHPDPAIAHVLRGWNPEGGPAAHDFELRDLKIRNVTTDIRGWTGVRESDGNSIFIFEVANLCIGHLGHLHHLLSAQHVGWIGQLDVVLVPVDGSFTMNHESMIEVLKDLRARLVIPMHFFGPTTLERFINALRGTFPVEMSPSSSVVLSEATLPETPKMLVLPGF